MPIYVYRNLTTGETFEVEQRMVDAALTTDPVTGDPVKRLIQPVGIAFKGSGFYVTDSRGSKGASANGAANGAAKGDAPKAADGAPKASSDAGAATPPPAPAKAPSASTSAAAD